MLGFGRKQFPHIPLLEGERVMLRRIMPGDAEDMYEYSRQPELTRFLLWDPHPSIEHTKRYIAYLQERYKARELYDWAVVLKESGKMIGTCGFASYHRETRIAEVGYVIAPAYQGCGFAPEALALLLRYAFCSMGLHRVEARCFVENEASKRVMEKCGLRYEGTARESLFVKGKYQTISSYAILASEYRMVGDA